MTASTSALAEAGGADRLRPALLDVTVNGQRGAEPMLLLEGPDGALYAPARTFAAWRLRLPTGAPVRFEEEDYYPISRLPSARVELRAEEQAVAIDLPAAAFEPQRALLDAFADLPMTRSGTGAFLNYDLLVEHAQGDTVATGAAELGIFTPHGVGQTGFVATAGAGRDALVRLDTSWSIDRPGNATSLRIGDSISAAGPGTAPVRFAGIHYFRNYAIRPGFITMPLPAAAGAAAVPSVVDVYVNNVLQGSREVAPGPFELANIPVQTGGGTVRLVVRDLLGREVITEQSYYATSQLLRRDLHEFSYEAGVVRRDFGRRSHNYGEFLVSTSHRYGLSDRLTLEGAAQASKRRQNVGAGIVASPFDLAQLGVGGSVSRGDRGVGYRLAASFERRSGGFSFGLLGEYRSARYGHVGMAGDERPPRFTVQAFADLPVGRGSLGFNFLHRSLRGQPDERVASLSGSYQLGGAAMLQLYARRVMQGRAETTFGASLTISFGGRRSTYVTSEYRGGRASGEISYQDNPPFGLGGGLRSTASFGPVRRTEAAYTHNLPMATVGAQLARAAGTTGVRVTAAGSVGLVGGDLFAARRLGGAFASVRLPGYPGVRVYADEQLVGVTRADGSIMVPGLRAFEPNRIRIDETDLPLDARIEATELVLRPYALSGAVVRFSARRERGVLLRLRREDGSAVPAGARLSVEGSDEAYVVASGGEAYVPNLSGRRRLSASWSGGRCTAVAEVPETDDPQPRLDGLVCSAEASYAAR